MTEADLHALVDGQLEPERHADVTRHLAAHPEQAARVQAWQRQRNAVHRLLDPVLDEPVPARLMRRAAPRAHRWHGWAAGIAMAVLSAGTAWTARGVVDDGSARLAGLGPATAAAAQGAAPLSGFARRAAVAHVVYSPDVRRPVEVGADQEQQLVKWLSARLGTPVRAPSLLAVGYELIGGRLLPGDAAPVAQFMYQDATGRRLTLYVTREAKTPPGAPETAFRFGQDGTVNVFYWVDRHFGYALSGADERQELLRVAEEVHRQLRGA